MILDLDGVPEARPTWRERWLRPIAAASLLAAVLLVSFARIEPRPSSVIAAAPSGPNALKVRVFAPGDARRVARTQFSGVTGLTPATLSDGFRDLYRLPDGRTVSVTEIPAGAAPARLPAGTIAWVSGGTLYLVGSGDVAPGELTELADRLR